MRVKSECHIQKAKPYFSKKYEQLLKYGLHLDAVTSRRAREHANEVGALDVTKNKYEQLLKYGLHLDAVISRWAREHANEVGALDVTKNNYERTEVWTALGCSNFEEGPTKWEVPSTLQKPRYIQEKSHFQVIFLFRGRWGREGEGIMSRKIPPTTGLPSHGETSLRDRP